MYHTFNLLFKTYNTRVLCTICFIFIVFILFPNKTNAQLPFLQNTQTPCVADFEDFLSMAIQFRPTYEGPFQPIFDINADGIFNFPDFILFRQRFNQNICLPIDSLAIKEQIVIQQAILDGIPQNQTQITIPFSDTLRNADASSPTLTTPIIDLETGNTTQYTYTLDLNLAEYYVIGKQLQTEVNGLLADSTTFTVDHWAFGIKGAYETPVGTLTLSTPFSPAQATLSLRPFAPTNINYFTPGVYTDATPMVPAADDTLTESTARTALETFLAKRITNPDTLQQALDTFDDATLIAKMPNPTLRAGLASLTGTLGATAIDAIRRGPFGPLTFGPLDTGDYAEVFSDRSVIVDERYASEAFPLFGPIFTRLALQLDLQTGRNEEITTSALLSLVAMQQTLTDSSIAQSGTELARRLNTQMLARLNSGQASFPNIGIYQTPNGQAFPNGTSFTSYANVFTPLEDTLTPASTLLTTYLTLLAPPNTTIPSTTTYTTDILTFIDQHQNLLTPDQLIQIARALKLKTETQ